MNAMMLTAALVRRFNEIKMPESFIVDIRADPLAKKGFDSFLGGKTVISWNSKTGELWFLEKAKLKKRKSKPSKP